MLSSYERTVRWRNNIKRKLILACGGGCRLCGYDRCDEALDFHHLDASSKDFGISSKIRKTAKIVAEAKKCILLCATCHREVHANARSCAGLDPIFDDNVFDRTPIESPCAHCGVAKRRALKFCSTACAALQRRKVSWETVDLMALLERYNFNVSQAARDLGISHAAVKKRMRKCGISRPDQPQ
jgi:hypothetical protein